NRACNSPPAGTLYELASAVALAAAAVRAERAVPARVTADTLVRKVRVMVAASISSCLTYPPGLFENFRLIAGRQPAYWTPGAIRMMSITALACWSVPGRLG